MRHLPPHYLGVDLVLWRADAGARTRVSLSWLIDDQQMQSAWLEAFPVDDSGQLRVR